jgi:hypothetical protein
LGKRLEVLSETRFQLEKFGTGDLGLHGRGRLIIHAKVRRFPMDSGEIRSMAESSNGIITHPLDEVHDMSLAGG